MFSTHEQIFNFMSKLQLSNMQQTIANTLLIIILRAVATPVPDNKSNPIQSIIITSNSDNLNKLRVAIFTCQGHINQVS